jgi:hypothetical protein
VILRGDDAEKILEQVVAVLGFDAFGMKLDPKAG